MVATLCYLVKNGKICLAEKQKKYCPGRLNGYGGKVEYGESIADAAMRELKEEAGVIVKSEHLEKVALLVFHNVTAPVVVRVHTYIAHLWEGDPSESPGDMGPPQWFPVHNLPLDRLPPADRVWLPLVLQGQHVVATASYTADQVSLIGEVEVERVWFSALW